MTERKKTPQTTSMDPWDTQHEQQYYDIQSKPIAEKMHLFLPKINMLPPNQNHTKSHKVIPGTVIPNTLFC